MKVKNYLIYVITHVMIVINMEIKKSKIVYHVIIQHIIKNLVMKKKKKKVNHHIYYIIVKVL